MLKTVEPSGLIWQRQSTKVRTWLCFHFSPSTSCSLFLAASTSHLFWHTLSPGMYWDLRKCEWLEALSPSSWFAHSDANIVSMCFSLCLRFPQDSIPCYYDHHLPLPLDALTSIMVFFLYWRWSPYVSHLLNYPVWHILKLFSENGITIIIYYYNGIIIITHLQICAN